MSEEEDITLSVINGSLNADEWIVGPKGEMPSLLNYIDHQAAVLDRRLSHKTPKRIDSEGS
jgi:hypothetical protein